MSSRVLNGRWVHASAQGFRFHVACILNACPVGDTTCSEKLSRSERVDLHSAISSSMPQVFSQDTIKTRKLNYCGERLISPLETAARMLSGCTLPESSKLDCGSLSPAVLGDPKAPLRCPTTAAAAAVGTRPLVSWQDRHRRNLSTSSSGGDSSGKPGGSVVGMEGEAETCEVEAGVIKTVEATAEEPRHTHVEMPEITEVRGVVNSC